MGSGQSSAKAAEAQEADTGTQLFGSWDKPVAEAYAKKASKKGKAVASKAADAADAALGSAIDLEAGAGVKPSGRKSPGKQKGAGLPKGGLNTRKRGEAWTLSQSTKDPAKVTAAEHALKGKLSKPVAKTAAQGVSKVQGSAGKKRCAEAWTLSQSRKSPAKVAAARKGLEGKLSKPRKSSQGTSTKKAEAPRSVQYNYAGMRRSSNPGPQMPRGIKTAFYSYAKKGVKKSGVVKKSKAAAGTASRMASEAAQEVATASKGAAAGTATAAQGAATAARSAATTTKSAATQAAKSAQKAVEESGVMDSTAVAEASQVASKVAEAVKEVAHTVQGATSVAVMQAGSAGASAKKAIKSTAAKTPVAAQEVKAAAAMATSEVKKNAGKVAEKAPTAKKALKRMVSEIDAEDAKTEGLGRGKRQRKPVKAFEPNM